MPTAPPDRQPRDDDASARVPVSSLSSPRLSDVDACPGAVDTHPAADGELARVRVPGGRLTASQAEELADTAEEFGDGFVELTSRANLQLRGLDAAHVGEFAARLADIGLLPSATHEKIRNIVASPLSGRGLDGRGDVTGLVDDLDAALCSEPELAALPGRFLLTVDDGGRDVADLRGDVGLVLTGPDVDDPVVLSVAGQPDTITISRRGAVAAVVAAARQFLVERAAAGVPAWRIAELPDGHERVLAAAADAAAARTGTAGTAPASIRPDRAPGPPARRPVGIVEQRDGRRALVVAVPLGRLSATALRVLADVADDGSGELRLTPWRSVVVPDLAPASAPLWAASAVTMARLVVDELSPWVTTSACAGQPGCAKALADVRADATVVMAIAAPGADPYAVADPYADVEAYANAGPADQPAVDRLPVHWSGCGRRCGAPAGRYVDVLATDAGYQVGSRGHGASDSRDAPASAGAADLDRADLDGADLDEDGPLTDAGALAEAVAAASTVLAVAAVPPREQQ